MKELFGHGNNNIIYLLINMGPEEQDSCEEGFEVISHVSKYCPSITMNNMNQNRTNKISLLTPKLITNYLYNKTH